MTPTSAGSPGVPRPLDPWHGGCHTAHMPSWTLILHLHGCHIAQPTSWWPSCAHSLLDPPAALSQNSINHYAFFPRESAGRGGARFLAGAEGSLPAGQGSLPDCSPPTPAVRAHVDYREFGHEVGEGTCQGWESPVWSPRLCLCSSELQI